MQQLVILLLVNCSSTCFGRLCAHPQEVRLRFQCLCLSVLLWCWRVAWQAVCTVWSRLHAIYSTQCSGNRPQISLLDIYHPDPWHAPVAATTIFNTPYDGRRKRPKRVE